MCLKVAVPFGVFMNKVAARIPDKWKNVAAQMNLTPAKINAINQECDSNANDCYMQVFREWSPYKSKTWSQLIEILRTEQVNEMELAQEIETNMNK